MTNKLLFRGMLLGVVLLAGGSYALKMWSFSTFQKLSTQDTGKTRPDRSADKDPKSTNSTSSMIAPSLDVSRIDPKGASVFAGRAAPNSQVTVFANNKAVGTAIADKFGEWTLLTEKPITDTDSKITLKAQAYVEKPRQPDRVASKAEGEKKAKEVTDRLMKKMEELVADAGSKSPTTTQAPATSTRKDPGIVPVPIKFVYRETTFTPDGEKAAKLLLTYLKLKNFASITLSGHADERGSDPFNYDLSEQRLEAVSKYLKDGGYQGRIAVIPKGETEPFQGINRDAFPLEEVYQLDRRVELQVVMK